VYPHSLALGHRASLIQEAKWHYGADYIAAYYRVDGREAARLLPPPLKAEGLAVAYVTEIVSLSEADPEAFYENPAQTAYREAAIGLACSFEGRPGIYFPCMWVDRDWSMARGLLNGYPKKIADDISMSRPHPLNGLIGGLRPGLRLGGYCVRQGRRLLSLRVSLERKGGEADVKRFGSVYGLRLFPRTHESQAEVRELVEVLRESRGLGEVWVGRAELEVGEARNEELGPLRPLEVLYGLWYSAGFTIWGAKVLKRLD
jgi:acetoacetate decarboxylase